MPGDGAGIRTTFLRHCLVMLVREANSNPAGTSWKCWFSYIENGSRVAGLQLSWASHSTGQLYVQEGFLNIGWLFL